MLAKGKIDKRHIHILSTEMMFSCFQLLLIWTPVSLFVCFKQSNATWWTTKGASLTISRFLCKESMSLKNGGNDQVSVFSTNIERSTEHFTTTLEPKIRNRRITNNAKYGRDFQSSKEKLLFFAHIVCARLAIARLPNNLRWTDTWFAFRNV